MASRDGKDVWVENKILLEDLETIKRAKGYRRYEEVILYWRSIAKDNGYDMISQTFENLKINALGMGFTNEYLQTLHLINNFLMYEPLQMDSKIGKLINKEFEKFMIEMFKKFAENRG